MKKLFALIMTAVMAFTMVACGSEESVEPEVTRSFIAGYNDEKTDESIEGGRVLVNLMSDGTADFYVATIADGVHSTQHYTGSYSLGENEEYDETISISYSYNGTETAEIKEAVIIDGIFEMPFFFIDKMTDNAVGFYETSPADMDGDVFIGYMTKVSGMGPMVYAYSLCLKDDGNFDVSIMQMASVMHVWGNSEGTYTVDGADMEFTYDIRTSDGEVVMEDDISVGTDYNGTVLKTAFNIQQSGMRASAAPFIKVK